MAFLAKWMNEPSPRPLLGRWCHVAYSHTCDPMRKAELNTIDHGVILPPTPPEDKKMVKKEEPWDHPTWIMISSGFGM